MARFRRLSTLLLIFLAGFSTAEAQRPGLAEARAWFEAARAWLDAQGGNTPKNPMETSLRAPSGDLDFAAVGVLLRLDGRVVGEAWKRGPETRAIVEALETALAKARADRRLSALPAELRERLGQRLTLELEFAGTPVALVGDRLDLLATRIEPALEALAIRNGDRWVFAMPSSVQAFNQSGFMNYLALTLSREVGLDPAASKDLKLPEGAAAYRCATRRLSQRDAASPAFESIRGRTVMPVASIDGQFLRAMATGLAAHLAQRWPTTDGLPEESAKALHALGPRSTFRPSRNEWPDPVSSPSDQALAALALAEFAQAAWATPTHRDQAKRGAVETLGSLRSVSEGEEDPASQPAAAAGALLAAAALDRGGPEWADDGTRAWLDGLRTRLLAPSETTARPAPAAAAMAFGVLGATAPEAWRTAAWDAADPDRVVTATPWLLSPDAVTPADAADAWRRTLPALAEAQFLARIDGATADDLDGGWSGGTGTPWPTAQSTRAALALATIAARQDLLDAPQRARAIETLRLAMRFLAQLQVDDDLAASFRDAARARHGVRAACWDSDLPMAASAYALLAAVRAAEALDRAAPLP
jgi:hypothetical protein